MHQCVQLFQNPVTERNGYSVLLEKSIFIFAYQGIVNILCIICNNSETMNSYICLIALRSEYQK